MTHPNSRTIVVQPVLSMINRANIKQSSEYANFNIVIGAFSASAISTGNGFDTNPDGVLERDLIMSRILGLNSNHPEFGKKLNEYFSRLLIRVKSEGLKLEVGLQISNSKPITYKETIKREVVVNGEVQTEEDIVYNLPINLEDYVKYIHCLAHPSVASNESTALSNYTGYLAYLEDTFQMREDKQKELEIRESADLEKYKVFKDIENVKKHLVLFGVSNSTIPTDEVEMKAELEKYVQERPQKFLDNVNDKEADVKYTVFEAIDYGVLNERGGIYYREESGEEYGTFDDLIGFLSAKKNKRIFDSLQRELQAAKNIK